MRKLDLTTEEKDKFVSLLRSLFYTGEEIEVDNKLANRDCYIEINGKRESVEFDKMFRAYVKFAEEVVCECYDNKAGYTYGLNMGLWKIEEDGEIFYQAFCYPDGGHYNNIEKNGTIVKYEHTYPKNKIISWQTEKNIEHFDFSEAVIFCECLKK